jgi:hypothetical protein
MHAGHWYRPPAENISSDPKLQHPPRAVITVLALVMLAALTGPGALAVLLLLALVVVPAADTEISFKTKTSAKT